MNLSVNYHNGTDTISLKLSRTPGVVGIATTEGIINVEMGVKEWLEVIGEVQRKIDLLQSCQTKWEQCREDFEAGRLAALAAELAKGQAADADLAAKIAEHGGAT